MPKVKQSIFSVLFLLPDYAQNWNAETFFISVKAKDAKAAVVEARKAAAKAVSVESNDDFLLLLCLAGDHKALDNGQGEID